MFSTHLLNAQPARAVLLAESALPPICILFAGIWLNPGKTAGQNVVGRPSPRVFAIVWVLLVIMWTFGLIFVALNTMDILSLVLIGVLSLIAILMCLLWMYMYKYKSKSAAAQVLLVSLMCMISTTVITTCSDTEREPRLLASWFFSVIAGWLAIASMLNLFEVN